MSPGSDERDSFRAVDDLDVTATGAGDIDEMSRISELEERLDSLQSEMDRLKTIEETIQQIEAVLEQTRDQRQFNSAMESYLDEFF